MSPNSSSSTTTHNCYDHYELKSEETHFSCDGCKMNGFGPRYTCNLCSDNLHIECRNPKPTISHDFFGCSTFSFIQTPINTTVDEEIQLDEPTPNYCSACGKDICGFSYHCKARNLYLHPCCRNLNKYFEVDDVVFCLKPNLCSEYSCCDGDEKGWSYVSSCKKYHFHVYCMMEKVHLAKIKKGNVELSDLLSRSSGEDINGSSFFQKFIKLLITGLQRLRDIVLELLGKHGYDFLKNATVLELLRLLFQMGAYRTLAIVAGIYLILKLTNLDPDNTSLHDLIEAGKNWAVKIWR